MIIYTIYDKVKKVRFAKTFDSPYFANKFEKKLKRSKRFEIIGTVYDYI